MQKANRKFILVIVILLIGCWAGCTRPKEEAQPDTTTTVILIRHAERDNFFTITAQGHKRAQAIVDAVKDMDIMAIYSPDLERNLKEDRLCPLR